MIVLDTCAVIWLVLEPSMLSKDAKEAITSARQSGHLYVSDISLYELAWLIRNRRITVHVPLEAFLSEVASIISVIGINANIARLSQELPASYPKDPMDRIIGATALDRGIPLVTRDVAIRRSKAVPVIW